MVDVATIIVCIVIIAIVAIIVTMAFLVLRCCAKVIMMDSNERENTNRLENTWNQPSMTRPLIEAEITAPAEQPYAHNPPTYHISGQYPPVPHVQPPPQYSCVQCSGAPPTYLPSVNHLNQPSPETGNGYTIIKISGNVSTQNVP